MARKVQPKAQKATTSQSTALVVAGAPFTHWQPVSINYASLRAQRAAALGAQLAALGTTGTAPAARPVAPAAQPVAPSNYNASAYKLAGNWQAVAQKGGQLTRQRPGAAQPVGNAWHATAVGKPNTRALVLQAVHALYGTNSFTYAQWAAALAPLAQAGTLGSGTPRSYLVAFVKQGYLAAAQ